MLLKIDWVNFEYKPYNIARFPKFFQRTLNFFSLGKNIRENYNRLKKEKNRSDGKLLDVIFKHY